MFDFKKFNNLLKEKEFTVKIFVSILKDKNIIISESAIKGYKTGRAQPRIELLKAFSEILCVKIDDLVK